MENIDEQPASFIGQRVTVSGEVDEIFSNRSFVIEDNSDVIFEDQVLVLTRPVAFGGATLRDDDRVVVRGKVRLFAVKDLETELGWDLDQSVKVGQWETKPVIVADSVSKVAEYARWTEVEEPEGVGVGLVSIYFVEQDPKTLIGQQVSLESVPVQAITEQGLWFGQDGGYRLFVAAATERRTSPSQFRPARNRSLPGR